MKTYAFALENIDGRSASKASYGHHTLTRPHNESTRYSDEAIRLNDIHSTALW